MLAVASAAPQQNYFYKQQAYQQQSYQQQPYQQQQIVYNKPAVVATITKTVTKPVSYQVPVATITRNDATVIEAAQPAQFVQQPQVVPQQPQYSPKPDAKPVVQIIKLERSQQPSGDYSYFFQADNGIQAQEKAVIKSVRDEKNEEHLVPNVEGSYTYTGPDGVQYTVNYVADEYGYRASGAHLPVAPEVPQEIQRSLQFISQQQPSQKVN